MESGETLGLIGDRHVKYTHVVSGGRSIIMMVRITGGTNAALNPPMIVLQTTRAHILFAVSQTTFLGFSIAQLLRVGWTLQRR